METKSVSIDELRTKLHQKIATLQSKRGLNGKSVGGVVEEPKSRQALLEARQARKQARKQKRKQESQQISSSATTTDASSKRKQPFDDGRIGDAAGAFGSAVKFSKIDFGAKKKRTKLDPKLALKKLQEEKSKAIQLDSNEVRVQSCGMFNDLLITIYCYTGVRSGTEAKMESCFVSGLW